MPVRSCVPRKEKTTYIAPSTAIIVDTAGNAHTTAGDENLRKEVNFHFINQIGIYEKYTRHH
jgi:hypothetical protein